MSSESGIDSGNGKPGKPGELGVFHRPQGQCSSSNINSGNSKMLKPVYRAVLAGSPCYRTTTSTPPSKIAANSGNRAKVGKQYTNPFASKKLLKRLKSGTFTAPSTTSSSGHLPPKKPAVTSQELHKTVELRYNMMKKQAEKSKELASSVKIPISSVPGVMPESPKGKKSKLFGDSDDSSEGSLTVQISGTDKRKPAGSALSVTTTMASPKNPLDAPTGGAKEIVDITLSSDEDETPQEVAQKKPAKQPPSKSVENSNMEKEKGQEGSHETIIKGEPDGKGSSSSTENLTAAGRRGQAETTPTKLACSSAATVTLKPLMSLSIAPSPKKQQAPRSPLVLTRKEGEHKKTSPKQDIIQLNVQGGRGALMLKHSQESRVGKEQTGMQSSSPQKFLVRGEPTAPMPLLPSPGKVLLPTPSVFQRLGKKSGGGGDNANSGGMWRTYDQAKQSEFSNMKKTYQKKQARLSKSQNNWKQQNKNAQHDWDTYQDKNNIIGGMQNNIMPSSSEDAFSLENESKGEIWRNGKSIKSASTSSPFDPFQRIPLSPAPPSAAICQMYEEMVWNAEESRPSYRLNNNREMESFADRTSFGSFLRTDSKHGNSLMPVFPRICRPQTESLDS